MVYIPILKNVILVLIKYGFWNILLIFKYVNRAKIY